VSASERLERLDAATELAVLPSPFNVIGNHGQWASLAEPYLALKYALPEIVAVVEAAERSVEFESGLGHYPIAAEALAALARKLEEA
jgi:hypothetical protein